MDMFQELKKKSLKKSLTATVILFVIAIGLWVISLDGVVDLVKGPQALEEISTEDYKSQYVETEVWYVFDCFAEYVSTNSKTNVSKTEGLYYIIPVGDETTQYMAVRVKPDVGDILDDICDETWEYLYGNITDTETSYLMTGKIVKMEEEELEHYYDWFEEAGFTQSEIDELALPYVIKDGMVGGMITSPSVPSAAIGFSAIGLVLFLIAVFRLVKALTGGYQKKMKKYIDSHEDISEAQVEADYASAKDFGGMKLGRSFTFILSGSKSELLKNVDIAWAYLQQTTHRRNGIKTGETYAVVLRTMDKKMYTIGLCNKDKVVEALNEYSAVAPDIVLGYSDERKKAYNADAAEFVRQAKVRRAEAEAYAAAQSVQVEAAGAAEENGAGEKSE